MHFREVASVFFCRTCNHGHERYRWATFCFFALWVLSVVASTRTFLVVLNLESFAILHVVMSLVAVVLSRSMASHQQPQPPYPYCFYLDRLSIVIRMGGAVFFIFGCFVCILKFFHNSMHTDWIDHTWLVVVSTAHFVMSFLARQDILLADRVFGNSISLFEASREERVLDLFTKTPLTPKSLDPAQPLFTSGDGNFFEKCNHQRSSSDCIVNSQLAMSGPSEGFSWSRLASLFGLFFMPLASLLTSLLIYCFRSRYIDSICASVLILYYVSIGLRQCRSMAWVLLNNSVRDASMTTSIDRILSKLKAIDGVLYVHSNTWFMVNAVDVVALARLCVMCNANAAAITATARKILMEVAKYAYVECLSANSTETELTSCGFNGKTISRHVHDHNCDHDSNSELHHHNCLH